MELCLTLDHAADFPKAARRVRDLERAGIDHVWVSEAYGFDAATRLGYLASCTERVRLAAGVLPLYSRTPALIAMTAAGLDDLSAGRCELGIGTSGPQVIEGWHGVPYDLPLTRTRETIEICRAIWRRDEPLRHAGRAFELPLPSRDGGVGAPPLKLIDRPRRPAIPIWVAAMGDRNVELAAEVADGWLSVLLLPERVHDVWGASLAAGNAKRDPALGPLQVAAGGFVAIGEPHEVQAVRDRARATVALYVGGMGSAEQNYYHRLAVRYGFGNEADEVRRHWVAGARAAAEAAVPDGLLDAVVIGGSAGQVAERIGAYEAVGVTHLNITPVPIGGRTHAQVVELVRELAPS